MYTMNITWFVQICVFPGDGRTTFFVCETNALRHVLHLFIRSYQILQAIFFFRTVSDFLGEVTRFDPIAESRR